MKTPSLRLQGLRWRTMTAGITFFLKSGLPFFTVAMTMSPTAAAGSLFNRPFTPFTEMTYKFLAPVLSAQLTTAPTGRASDIRNLFPAEPPRPGNPQPFINTHESKPAILQYQKKIPPKNIPHHIAGRGTSNPSLGERRNPRKANIRKTDWSGSQ